MVEMVDRLKILKKVKAVKRRSYTDDGEQFFVEVIMGTAEAGQPVEDSHKNKKRKKKWYNNVLIILLFLLKVSESK